jgi:hypothetical protein
MSRGYSASSNASNPGLERHADGMLCTILQAIQKNYGAQHQVSRKPEIVSAQKET